MLNKLLRTFYIIGSMFLIALMIIVIYFSSQYYLDTYQLYSNNFEAKVFYLGLYLAIVTTAVQWIEGRLKIFVKKKGGHLING